MSLTLVINRVFTFVGCVWRPPHDSVAGSPGGVGRIFAMVMVRLEALAQPIGDAAYHPGEPPTFSRRACVLSGLSSDGTPQSFELGAQRFTQLPHIFFDRFDFPDGFLVACEACCLRKLVQPVLELTTQLCKFLLDTLDLLPTSLRFPQETSSGVQSPEPWRRRPPGPS